MWKAFLLVAVSSHVAAAEPKAGSCEATEKQHAKSIRLGKYKPPADCSADGGDHKPRAITSEAGARVNIVCKDPKFKFGIDFKKHQLIVTARSYSPAQVGLDVYDDGKVVTFVNRERSPCKGDPQPMPGPGTTLLFQAAAGARTFVDGSCTVATKCP